MAADEWTPRLATPDDADEVARLLHDFNTEFEDETPGVEALTEHTRPLLESGEVRVFLAGEVDGISLWRLRPSPWTGRPEAYLQELYVVPALRGNGLGGALLEAAMETARGEGAEQMELGTSEDDVAARKLYESAGFINREGGPDGPVMFFYEREL